MGVYSGFITHQSFKCVCVWSVDTHCACTQSSLSIFTMLAQLFFLHCTLVWLFCHKTHLLSSPDPTCLWLVQNNTLIFTPPQVWANLPGGTTVQIMPRLNSPYLKYCGPREYPDSTISKVLTTLKWQKIGNCQKNRGQNHFTPYEVRTHIGHFFTMSMLLQFYKPSNPVYN